MMADEQLLPLEFPVNGLDLTGGFGAQRPGTTPVGINVRTFEPGTQRGRGGSRQGLSRYVLPQLPTAAKVQCLDYVVDPSATALLANFGNGTLNDPGVLDPSTNPPGSNPADPTDFRVRNRGNTWRTGGSGLQPNRNLRLTINNPYTGTISASPVSVPTDGVTTSTITVTASDRYGFPLAHDSVSISTSPSGRVGDGLTIALDGFGVGQFDVTDTTSESVTYTAQDTTKSFTIGSTSVSFGGWTFNGVAFSNLFVAPGANNIGVTLGGITKNDWLFLGVTCSASLSGISVTDSMGNSWGQASSDGIGTRLFRAQAQSNGAAAITLSASASGSGAIILIAADYTGPSGQSTSQVNASNLTGGTVWDAGILPSNFSNGAVFLLLTDPADRNGSPIFTAAGGQVRTSLSYTVTVGMTNFVTTISLIDMLNVNGPNVHPNGGVSPSSPWTATGIEFG